MYRMNSIIALSAMLGSATAFALDTIDPNYTSSDDDTAHSDEYAYNEDVNPGMPGTANDSTVATTTRAESRDVTRGYLRDEMVGLKPQVGILAFKDDQGNNTSRLAAGIALDMNLMSFINREMGNVFIGPATGFIYSHLGSASSNFVGTDPSSASGGPGAGANLLVIPADLKLGYTFGDNLRVSARGGGNVVYRSVASSMNLGSSSASGDSLWRIFPNIGADFEVGFGQNVALMLRPDVTLTPGDAFFTGTLALGIVLG